MSIDKTTDLKQAFLSLVSQRLSDNSHSYFIGFGISRHRLSIPYASNRICDMPIAEESILGIAIGMSRVGNEVFVDLMFEAFAFRTMDVLVNQTALSALLPMTRRAPIIVRMLCGPFAGAGPQHGGAGYALLARLPNIIVAAPSKGSGIAIAYNFARNQGKLLLLLFGGDDPITELLIEEGNEESLVYRMGNGKKLAVVSWGLHAQIIQQAISNTNASEGIRVLLPLFLNPLPTHTLLRMLDDVNEILIVDGSLPPATLGELLAVEVAKYLPELHITLHNLLEQGIGAQYNRDNCIESLATVISNIIYE